MYISIHTKKVRKNRILHWFCHTSLLFCTCCGPKWNFT